MSARSEVFRKPNISTGNVSASITPPSEVTAAATIGNTTGSASIPAGALKVLIYFFGFFQSGDDGEAVGTINGQNWPNGVPYEAQAIYDPANEQYKPLPAYTIEGNGARVFYHYLT